MCAHTTSRARSPKFLVHIRDGRLGEIQARLKETSRGIVDFPI